MKKILTTAIIGLLLSACSDSKKEEKDFLDGLLKVHDKVMRNDDALMKNKMQVDSLLKIPSKDTIGMGNLKVLDTKIQSAEEAMETWMAQFEPDVTNKSHDEIMKYYSRQKQLILAVDSQMNVAIAKSSKYLSSRTK